MSHTFVTLEVGQAVFAEIHAKLLEAGYEHALTEDCIDMHGLALVPSPEPETAMLHAEHLVTGAKLVDGVHGTTEARDQLIRVATMLMESARDLGFVLTIETSPLKPLAMGNYEMLAIVRPARNKEPSA